MKLSKSATKIYYRAALGHVVSTGNLKSRDWDRLRDWKVESRDSSISKNQKFKHSLHIGRFEYYCNFSLECHYNVFYCPVLGIYIRTIRRKHCQSTTSYKYIHFMLNFTKKFTFCFKIQVGSFKSPGWNAVACLLLT